MIDTTQGNAMTEIALAMAMGFFSVMVLTMMSMGVGTGTVAGKAVASVVLAPAATGNDASAVPLKDDDLLVIYDGRRFFGRDLAPVEPSRLDTGRRIILAADGQSVRRMKYALVPVNSREGVGAKQAGLRKTSCPTFRRCRQIKGVYQERALLPGDRERG